MSKHEAMIKEARMDLDAMLDAVSYEFLNSTAYMPGAFALRFMNFIKLVNGGTGDTNLTPPMHLRMLDGLEERPSDFIVNLLFRGAAKTSVFGEYLSLYIAVFGELPILGKLEGMLYISDSMDNGVKNFKQNLETRYNASAFMQEWVPDAKFTENQIWFYGKANPRLSIKMFGAKTGIRGSKIFAQRPKLAILDDLLSDDDARSQVALASIKDTVYKGVIPALDPGNRLVILNGTPFHKEDLMVSAVESGGWHANVWPVCERFPCEESEFRSAWPDRFTYAAVKAQYEFAVKNGQLASFMQEMMLRITSEEGRLVQDGDIRWYSRAQLLRNKHHFNFYITTDFATSEKQKADYSVISVWAYNANGDWFWVDGIAERQTLDVTINDLFRLAQEYKPMEVGIEVTGQQGAFIKWIQQIQMDRNLWFNFASSNQSGAAGVRPIKDKLSRFGLVVPWFKAGRIHFPSEMKTSAIMGMFMGQLRLATREGLKGKDDCLDTISQLTELRPFKPAEGTSVGDGSGVPDVWSKLNQPERDDPSPMSSYLV